MGPFCRDPGLDPWTPCEGNELHRELISVDIHSLIAFNHLLTSFNHLQLVFWFPTGLLQLDSLGVSDGFFSLGSVAWVSKAGIACHMLCCWLAHRHKPWWLNRKTSARLPAFGIGYKLTTYWTAHFQTRLRRADFCTAMTSATTGRILEEILEYLPVLTVPSRERLLLKDTAATAAWIAYCIVLQISPMRFNEIQWGLSRALKIRLRTCSMYVSKVPRRLAAGESAWLSRSQKNRHDRSHRTHRWWLEHIIHIIDVLHIVHFASY